MKIAVMGAGALGCYFGGRIAAAGGDIAFVARGAHLDAMKRDGIRIESPLGDAVIQPVHASDDPGEIGPVDMVLFLVKMFDTESAARQMAPLIGPDTQVITFQNGIDGAARLGAIVGAERVLDGIAYIPAHISAPGTVHHGGPLARLVFGEADGAESTRTRALLGLLQNAGIEAEITADIQRAKWEKFVMLSAMSAVTALTRLPLGPVLADPHCAELFRDALGETAAVGRVFCPTLPADAAEKAMETAHGFRPQVRASMAEDLNRGKRIELMHLSGAVVRLGEERGVDTPTHRTVLRALHPFLEGAPAA